MPTPNPGLNCTRGAVQTLFIGKKNEHPKRIEQPRRASSLRGRGAFGGVFARNVNTPDRHMPKAC